MPGGNTSELIKGCSPSLKPTSFPIFVAFGPAGGHGPIDRFRLTDRAGLEITDFAIRNPNQSQTHRIRGLIGTPTLIPGPVKSTRKMGSQDELESGVPTDYEIAQSIEKEH